MPRLKVSVVLDATPDTVWSVVEDIGSHTEWIRDAVAIRFTSDRESGVGTTFDCDTKIGPFRLTDKMEITSWKPSRQMGVRHVGMVTGSGVFTMRPQRSGFTRRPDRSRTRFVWTERLSFPWYFAGPVGAFVARPVLRRVWKRNLADLKALVDS